MTNALKETKKKGIRYWLLRVLGGGVLLLLLAILVLTSSWGLQHLTLPLASRVLQGELLADRIELGKRHSVEVGNLRVSLPSGLQVRLPYGFLDLNLWRVLRGEYIVTAAGLRALDIHLRETTAPSPTTGREKASTTPALLPAMTFQNTKLHRGRFRYENASGLTVGLNEIDLDFLVCGTAIVCKTKGAFELHYEKAAEDPTVLAQRVNGKVSIQGNATLSRAMEVEDYTLEASLEPLDVLQFPVRFENGRAVLSLKGKRPTGSENELNFLWRNLSVPGTLLPSEGMLKSSITLVPKKEIRFSNTLLQLYEQSQTYADISSEGDFQFEHRQVNAVLHVLHLDDRILKLLPIPPSGLDGFSVRAELTPHLSFAPDAKGELSGKLVVDSLAIREPKIAAETLRGSTFEFSALVLGKSISLRSLNAQVESNQKRVFDLSGEAQLELPNFVQANLRSSLIAFDEIRSLTGVKSSAAGEKHADGAKQSENTTKAPEREILLPPLPSLQLRYEIAKLESQSIPFSGIHIAVNHATALPSDPIQVEVGAKSGNADIHASMTAHQKEASPPSFAFSLDTRNFPLRELLGLQAKDSSIGDSGTIDSLRMDFTTAGQNLSDLKRGLKGRTELLATKASLPSKFQDIPPFNLIFLPLEIVANIAEKTTGFLLPQDLLSTASGLRSELSEQGRLRLKKVQLHCDVQDGEVKISRGTINPNLLPGVEYTGSIGFDGDLDLRAFITLLGVRVPLPIAGSLNTPLPNVLRFVPELIRGLGLSALDIVNEVIPGSEDEKVEKIPREIPEQPPTHPQNHVVRRKK